MNRDIALSPDGDLMLGQQLVDEEGFLLYWMGGYRDGDTPLITNDPNLGIRPVRDMKEIFMEESELQLIKNRVQTEAPDWKHYPNLGGNLTDLIGMPNTSQTAEYGVELITKTLTYDKAFKTEELIVNGIPVGKNQLLFDIKLIKESRIVRYALTYDLDQGLINNYEKITNIE